MTEVVNLATDGRQIFTLPPDEAVVAAYEQEHKNWNTWQYPAPENHSEFVVGQHYVACGDFTARKE